MHPNPVFRSDDRARSLAFAAERGFGILTVQGPDGILASHIPFVLDGDALCAHVPRSNAIGRALRDGPLEALMIVSGPDAYISPDWYELDDQVPTWNYVAVHIRGALQLAETETLAPHLAALSASFEERLAPKKPWTMDKNEPGTLDKLMRMLLPLRLDIRDVDATWKLAQNKPADARLAAATGVEPSGIGHHPAEIARLMRDIDTA